MLFACCTLYINYTYVYECVSGTKNRLDKTFKLKKNMIIVKSNFAGYDDIFVNIIQQI